MTRSESLFRIPPGRPSASVIGLALKGLFELVFAFLRRITMVLIHFRVQNGRERLCRQTKLGSSDQAVRSLSLASMMIEPEKEPVEVLDGTESVIWTSVELPLSIDN